MSVKDVTFLACLTSHSSRNCKRRQLTFCWRRTHSICYYFLKFQKNSMSGSILVKVSAALLLDSTASGNCFNSRAVSKVLLLWQKTESSDLWKEYGNMCRLTFHKVSCKFLNRLEVGGGFCVVPFSLPQLSVSLFKTSVTSPSHFLQMMNANKFLRICSNINLPIFRKVSLESVGAFTFFTCFPSSCHKMMKIINEY